MAKRRVRRYTNEFKQMCVERMKQCDNIGGLAKELSIHRRMLYRWRDQFDPVEKGAGPAPPSLSEATLRKEVSRLKQALADKTLELDFSCAKVPCKKSRFDASSKTSLARRHLRSNMGSDVFARQLEY